MTKTLSFEEHVRKRPFMFFGTLMKLFVGVVTDCIDLCKTDNITFEISINGDNDYTISLSSTNNLQPFLNQLSDEPEVWEHLSPKVLRIISDKFEIVQNDTISINFSFDRTIINHPTIDYLELMEKMLCVALVNRNSEILTIDKRQKIVSQNYFYFPQGVFYLLESEVTKALGTPEIQLTYDDQFNNRSYQIGIAYRKDWFPQPTIISFANHIPTTYGGSLVEGIIEGIINGCKKHVKQNQLKYHRVTQKKCLNGLILVCAVKGDEFEYRGSTKECLDNANVREEAFNIVTELVLQYFQAHPELSERFFWRFDTKKIGSKMF